MINISLDSKIKVKKIDDIIDLPVVINVSKFDEASAHSFRDAFARATNTGQKIIPIVIDSYGGQVYSLLSMVGILKTSSVPIATILTGKGMSCGSILFSFGTEGYRFMDPFSTMMIHEVSVGTVGKVEEVKVDAKEVERLNQYLFKLMANNVGKADDYFLKLIHERNHADLFLSAEEAKSHNIANHLRIPSFKVKLSVETSFE